MVNCPNCRIEVQTEGGLLLQYPAAAPDSLFWTFSAESLEFGWADDFETDQGWVAGGTATTGLFVREDPREVKDSSKNVVQPDDDVTADPGVHAWVTGNGPGPNGSDDVDGGTSTVTSPTVDATDFAALTLSYARWYYAFPSTAPPSDYLRVQWSRDGTTWNTLEERNGGEPSWVTRDLPLPLSAFGPGLQVRFVADDDPLVAIDSARSNSRRILVALTAA